MHKHTSRFHVLLPLLLLLAALSLPARAGSWWDKEWTIRKKITIDLSASGAAVSEPVGQATVLVRLHDGNFQFDSAKERDAELVKLRELHPAWHLRARDRCPKLERPIAIL